MRVRATAPVRAYQPANCGFLTGDTGTEWDGDDAVFLAATGAPVEVIDAEPTEAPASPEAPPAPEAPAVPELERVDDDSAPDAAFDPADHTVDEVIEYVQANPSQRAAVLALETADDGKQRVTIVKALGD